MGDSHVKRTAVWCSILILATSLFGCTQTKTVSGKIPLSSVNSLRTVTSRLNALRTATPDPDEIGPSIDYQWCGTTGTYPYSWAPIEQSIVGVEVTFRKSLELRGVNCPSGAQVTQRQVLIPSGERIYWCSHRAQPGVCERLVNYDQPSNVVEIHILPANNRVEEDIHSQIPVWYGVRNCEDDGDKQALRVAGPWIARTRAQYPYARLVDAGYRGTMFSESRQAESGAHKCKAGFSSLIVYAQFQLAPATGSAAP